MDLFKDYIRVYPLLSPRQCTKIITEYDAQCNQPATSATEYGNQVLKNHRDCDVLGIKNNEEVEETILESVDLYKQSFPLCAVNEIIDSQFLRYGIGGRFNAHVDSYTQTLRTLSVSIILNDNYTGGDFAFFDRTGTKELHNIAPTQGDVIVFPSMFMFPHGVKPVKFGTRYAVVSWLN